MNAFVCTEAGLSTVAVIFGCIGIFVGLVISAVARAPWERP